MMRLLESDGKRAALRRQDGDLDIRGRLIDLPEEYLLWFARKDEFPAGRLGELMAITLLIKTEGLTQLVQPRNVP